MSDSTTPDPTDRLRAKLAELDAAGTAAEADQEMLRAAEERDRVAALTDSTPASQTTWMKTHRALETATARHAEIARDRDLLTAALQRAEHEAELARRAQIVAENERRRLARAAAGPALHAELARLAPTIQRFTACALAAAAVQGVDVGDVGLLLAEWLGGTRHHTGLSGPNPAVAQARAEAEALLARLENGETLS